MVGEPELAYLLEDGEPAAEASRDAFQAIVARRHRYRARRLQRVGLAVLLLAGAGGGVLLSESHPSPAVVSGAVAGAAHSPVSPPAAPAMFGTRASASDSHSRTARYGAEIAHSKPSAAMATSRRSVLARGLVFQTPAPLSRISLPSTASAASASPSFPAMRPSEATPLFFLRGHGVTVIGLARSRSAARSAPFAPASPTASVACGSSRGLDVVVESSPAPEAAKRGPSSQSRAGVSFVVPAGGTTAGSFEALELREIEGPMFPTSVVLVAHLASRVARVEAQLVGAGSVATGAVQHSTPERGWVAFLVALPGPVGSRRVLPGLLPTSDFVSAGLRVATFSEAGDLVSQSLLPLGPLAGGDHAVLEVARGCSRQGG